MSSELKDWNDEPSYVFEFLLRSAELFPGKIYISQAGRQATYQEVLDSSRRVAEWLIESGLHPGDRVAILLDDPCEYVAAYFGILLAGGIVVGLNTETSPRNVAAIIDDCQVSCLLGHRKFWRNIAPALDATHSVRFLAIGGGLPEATPGTGPKLTNLGDILGGDTKCVSHATPDIDNRGASGDSLAQIIYTSGTTGEPKGVMLSHKNLIANTLSIVEYLRLTEHDRVMAVLPFFYSYGNSLLLTHTAVGGALIVNQRFVYPNIVLDQMAEEQVTGFSGVPSTFAILLHRSSIRDYKFPALRYVTQAGGPMSPHLARELQEILPNVDLYIMYGQTEAAARLSYLSPQDLCRKPGSIGKAIPGVELEIRRQDGTPAEVGEVGELVATGENVMIGYWGRPEATAEVLRSDGLWTGDLARKDDEGFLFIVSRKSDMIKSGAHRIAPREIEDVIVEVDAIQEAAVVGVTDEILGEAIKAFVVLKPGAACTGREVVSHCRRHLPAYKVPQQIEFREGLPKTTSGKIRKEALKSIAATRND